MCDSFKINEKCVPPSLMANRNWMLYNSTTMYVRFNSYRHNGEEYTNAELSLTGELSAPNQ